MKWAECKAALRPVLRDALEDYLKEEELDEAVFLLGAEIASFINERFGLESDT